MILLAITLALGATSVIQGEEPEALPPFTMEEWRKLPERQRAIDVIGGIEGLLLAASGARGDEIGVDQACLGKVQLTEVMGKLMDEEIPDRTPFTMAVLEVTGCNR